ncbi:hypothetical protein G9A89_000919 [Geosiphon pyriformis]|nr:hypothetical protein G9A89_000919 [Geosiphon pyriformis]
MVYCHPGNLPSEILQEIFRNFVKYSSPIDKKDTLNNQVTSNVNSNNDNNNSPTSPVTPTSPNFPTTTHAPPASPTPITNGNTEETEETYDLKSLLSCILVSKHWSENAIYLLWSQPFHHTLPKPSQRSLINTLLSCLSPEDREGLLLVGIKFPSYFFASCPYQQPRPYYAYPAFMRHFNFYKMVAAVSAREEQYEEDHYNQMSKIKLVLKSLMRLFVDYNTQVETLVISTRVGGCSVQDHDDLLNTRDARKLLSDIRGLKIEATKYMFTKTFTNLAGFSKHVRYMDIEWSDQFQYKKPEEMKNNWKNLLSTPSHLFHLRIYNTKRCDIIIPPLQTQAHCLRTIKFEKVDFDTCEPLDEIMACRKLVALKFDECSNVYDYMIEPLVKGKLPRLQRLSVVGGTKCDELKAWAKKFTDEGVKKS